MVVFDKIFIRCSEAFRIDFEIQTALVYLLFDEDVVESNTRCLFLWLFVVYVIICYDVLRHKPKSANFLILFPQLHEETGDRSADGQVKLDAISDEMGVQYLVSLRIDDFALVAVESIP